MLSNRAHTTSRPEAPELHQIKVKSTPLAAEMPKLHCPRGIAFNWRILESTGEAIFPAVGLSLRRAPMASGAREACQPMCAASYGRGGPPDEGLRARQPEFPRWPCLIYFCNLAICILQTDLCAGFVMRVYR